MVFMMHLLLLLLSLLIPLHRTCPLPTLQTQPSRWCQVSAPPRRPKGHAGACHPPGRQGLSPVTAPSGPCFS